MYVKYSFKSNQIQVENLTILTNRIEYQVSENKVGAQLPSVHPYCFMHIYI